MNTAERAVEIQSLLERDRSLSEHLCGKPMATEVPLDATKRDFLLMINFCIKPSAMSLATLWELTVPVIHHLFETGAVSQFASVAVQVSVMEDDQSFERVLQVGTRVSDIEQLPTRKEALLEEAAWRVDRFTCYWYRDKGSIK